MNNQYFAISRSARSAGCLIRCEIFARDPLGSRDSQIKVRFDYSTCFVINLLTVEVGVELVMLEVIT